MKGTYTSKRNNNTDMAVRIVIIQTVTTAMTGANNNLDKVINIVQSVNRMFVDSNTLVLSMRIHNMKM